MTSFLECDEFWYPEKDVRYTKCDYLKSLKLREIKPIASEVFKNYDDIITTALVTHDFATSKYFVDHLLNENHEIDLSNTVIFGFIVTFSEFTKKYKDELEIRVKKLVDFCIEEMDRQISQYSNINDFISYSVSPIRMSIILDLLSPPVDDDSLKYRPDFNFSCDIYSEIHMIQDIYNFSFVDELSEHSKDLIDNKESYVYVNFIVWCCLILMSNINIIATSRGA